ncbi:hypothetical protein [Hyphomicrobium sp. LHD-15]|uniref:hypothetical protein n=1 Tax=Hyphomicrobium sp. LHD-15 TaxID=3072142 RepID=UPI00280FD5A2|nr:hypothetical protein [Hyphomicrobium sp. LHD-15]MDQ8697304.1 hypothetical protein [Hyphomicrobium sp. LHD-15]
MTAKTVFLAAAGMVLTSQLLAGCSSGPATPPPPASPGAEAGDGIRRSPVVAGRRARVFVMAGFGTNCESLPAPNIIITAPPAKGSVTFEPGQETTITTSASGTCIGQRVAGTGIYYTARATETGPDSFSIQAELGGDITRRTFSVDIVQ